MKKRKKHPICFGILSIFLLILVYLIIACVPYTKQGKEKSDTVDKFRVQEFYSEETGEDRACILFQNSEALEERIRLISHAQDRIILSTFDFKTDNSGKRMICALYNAAQRGVKVQILVDGFSYFLHMQGKEEFQALAAHDNVTFKVYNPVNLLKPQKLMARLHDKYLIVDETAYILGGRNSYDYFLGDETDYRNYDWDVFVCPQGSASASSLIQVEQYFDSIWNLKDCRIIMKSQRTGKRLQRKLEETGSRLQTAYRQMEKDKPEWFEDKDYRTMTVETNNIRLLSNPVEASLKEPVLFYNITELMKQGKGDVYFHTPYIICNDYMMGKLKEVCNSGKSVCMMTNSFANNGNPFGAVDYKRNKGKILNTGVNILEYDKGVSYHGKCFTVGDRITGVGSFNWDMRSAYLDTELMLVIDSIPLNAQMRKYMEIYEEDSLIVTGEKNYDLKAGQIPRTITTDMRIQVDALYLLDPLLRFLM